MTGLFSKPQSGGTAERFSGLHNGQSALVLGPDIGRLFILRPYPVEDVQHNSENLLAGHSDIIEANRGKWYEVPS